MFNQVEKLIKSELNTTFRFKPSSITLLAMWILTTTLLIIMLFNGVRSSDNFQITRYVVQVGYVISLLWYLGSSAPSLRELPEIKSVLLSNKENRKIIPVIGIALLFIVSFMEGSFGIVLLTLIIASILILIFWFSEIRLHQVIIGVVISIIAFLGGLPLLNNQFVGKPIFFLFLSLLTPMYVAGCLLFAHTGLGGSQSYLKQYSKAIMSFIWGCILFIPLGLLNAATGSPGSGITWVTEWWMPLTLPFYSAIVEEVWYRLFLVTMCYLLLRPAFNKVPWVAILISVLFSGIVFGLGHGGSFWGNLIVTGLLYGLPMSFIYVKRNLEYAIGAHFMINMIPWLMVYTTSS